MEITQKQLQAAISETENDHDIELRENYSGRGMYGRETWGVVGETTALEEFEGYLAAYMLSEDPEYNTVNAFDLLGNLTDIRDARRSDSMGRDDSIFYYPNINLVEED